MGPAPRGAGAKSPASTDPCLHCTDMPAPLSIIIPHQLGRAEARRRIESGFSKLVRQLPGGGSGYVERWDGDRLTFSVSALGQSVSGVVDVLDDTVAMKIELPAVLRMIAASLRGKIQEAGRLMLTKN